MNIEGLLKVFLISMLPIVELRGAVPVGIAMGLGPVETCIAAIAGNLVPVPFLVLFVRKLLEWLQTKSKFLNRIIESKYAKLMRNHEKKRYRSELIALAVFVAIPLPGTGAWTGSLLAALLNIQLKKSFPAIAAGVVVAGVIVTVLSMLIREGAELGLFNVFLK